MASQASALPEAVLEGSSQDLPDASSLLTKEDSLFGLGLVPSRHKLTIAAFIWWCSGVFAFMHFEGYDFVTAVFVVAQMITTVGYGDIVPTHDSMKLFLGLYALVGIGLAAGALDSLTEWIITSAQEKTRAKMRAVEDKLNNGGDEDDAWSDEKRRKTNLLLASFGIWALTIAFGTVYFGYWDNCQCDSGAQACDMPVLGGHCPVEEQRSLIDAFYMCCITVTTIGFGDQTPQTTFGRAVGTVWMIIGIAATLNFISSLTDWMSEERKRPMIFTRELYDQIEKDDTGRIHKWQFLMFMLRKHDMCDQDDMDFIIAEFHKLDIDGSGKLTLADLPSAHAARSKWKKAGNVAIASSRMSGDTLQASLLPKGQQA